MTRRRRPSRFRDRATAAGAFALLLAAGVMARPRDAAAQACCVGTGLVTPARLRTFEDRAFGLQMRARSVMGAFGPTGSYATSQAGTSDVGLEEDLFGALRLGSHLQIALLAPFVQTARSVPGTSGFGGGIGDVAASARYDVTNAGTRGAWPGVALLASLAVPTGTPPDEADDPLATSGTGTGSFEGSLGFAVEEIVGSGFVSLSGFVSKRTARDVDGIEQTFSLRLSAVLAGGYTFGHDTTVGAFASALRQGDSRDANGPLANSSVALVTAGAALATPFWQWWRVQATFFTDVPLAGWGRNQTVGLGGTVAVIRSWI